MPTICTAILTYNRHDTLAENMPDFLALGADQILFVDNHSTDGTPDLLAEVARGRTDVQITRNRMNLGYSRSFVKTFIDVSTDYITYLSDEDCPTPQMVTTYRLILDKYPDLGVVARAVPYPDVWSIKALDETEIVAQTEDYVIIRPGLYAAHLATYQSTYVGGLMLNCTAVANFGKFSLEQGSYPQKMMAMDAAYNAGIALVKRDDHGKFPKAHASTKKETMTSRQGDWGLAEWVETARFFEDFYPGDGVEPAALGAIREKQIRYAMTRLAFYFENISTGGYEPTLAFMRSVRQTSDMMAQASTWVFNHNWMTGRFKPEQMQLFHRCCRALDTEKTMPPRGNPFLHDHTRFGRTFERIPLAQNKVSASSGPLKDSLRGLLRRNK